MTWTRYVTSKVETGAVWNLTQPRTLLQGGCRVFTRTSTVAGRPFYVDDLQSADVIAYTVL